MASISQQIREPQAPLLEVSYLISVRSFLRPAPAPCRRSRSEGPGTSMPELHILTPTSTPAWRLLDGNNGPNRALRPPASPLVNMEITVRVLALWRVRRLLLSLLMLMSLNSSLPVSSSIQPGSISHTLMGRRSSREPLPLFQVLFPALSWQVLLFQLLSLQP